MEPDGSLDPIQEESDGIWKRAEGDIRQRFPVRMYSQKQIFQLAKTPLALLKIVDDAPEVNHRFWKEQWKSGGRPIPIFTRQGQGDRGWAFG